MSDVEAPRCTATNARGERCKRRPILGGTVCLTHGGSAPQVRAAANHRLDQAQIAAAIELWGGRKDVHPAQALLNLVQQKAMEVDFWRYRVSQVAADDLLWGVTKTKTGGEDYGTTEEAKPNAALVQLRQCERDLADYSAMALRAGCDAALVELHRAQSTKVLAVLQVFVSDRRVTVEGDPGLVILDALKGLAA